MTPSRFDQLRPMMFGIAYRMLGDVGDAEDLVQDAWLRLADADDVADGYAVRTITRLAIDHLRSARVRREQYVGPWLPEPLCTDPQTPESIVARARSLRLALLLALEALSPDERAAFVLRELLELPYPDVAAAMERSEASCRQLVSRGRRALPDAPTPDARVVGDTLNALLAAVAARDVDAVGRLLADECRLLSDGGGKRAAARRPVVGRDAVRAFVLGLAAQRTELVPHIIELNGEPALVLTDADQRTGRVDAIVALDVRPDGTLHQLFIVRNPDKLTRCTPS